jgi:metal-responsive CopG/Arc/MetJ family transcriptional regulator
VYEHLFKLIVMKEKIAVGVRIPQEHLQEIDAICQTTGKSRSQVLLDAVEMYLGKVSNDCVRSELEDVKHRLTVVEKRILAWMGQN